MVAGHVHGGRGWLCDACGFFVLEVLTLLKEGA
jgi:hypothetical protein